MLEEKYVNDTIRSYYDQLPIFAPLIYIGLGVNRSFADFPQIISGLRMALEKPLNFGGRDHHKLQIRILNYDETMAPIGKAMIIVKIEPDYDYWQSLRTDMRRYNAEKQQIGDAVIGILNRRFPDLANQIEMVDVATPVTFVRYTGWRSTSRGNVWSECYSDYL